MDTLVETAIQARMQSLRRRDSQVFSDEYRGESSELWRMVNKFRRC